MNTNENKKKLLTRVRVTPLDLALVLLALLIVISIWQKNNIQFLFEKQKQEKSYVVTFELVGVRISSAELLEENTSLYFYDDDEKVLLGKLGAAPIFTPYTQTYVNTQGESVTIVYPSDDRKNGKVNFCGTFICHGAKNDHVLVHEEGLRMQTGESFLLATELGDFEAQIISITEIEA